MAFLEYLNFIHLHFHQTVPMLAISKGRATRENEEFLKEFKCEFIHILNPLCDLIS